MNAGSNASEPLMQAGKMRSSRIVPGVRTAREIVALVEKNDQALARKITERNMNQMMTLSADELDRMLYRVGLASNSMVRRVQNEKNRRDFNQRRVSAKVSQLSNLQSL